LPPSDKEIISFADALDKLEKVARKLTPPMMDVGTQTELTAEQITQMEQSIAKYQTDIQTEQDKVNTLTNQLTNLQGEIKNLQEQVKDLKPNEAEKQVIDFFREYEDVVKINEAISQDDKLTIFKQKLSG